VARLNSRVCPGPPRSSTRVLRSRHGRCGRRLHRGPRQLPVEDAAAVPLSPFPTGWPPSWIAQLRNGRGGAPHGLDGLDERPPVTIRANTLPDHPLRTLATALRGRGCLAEIRSHRVGSGGPSRCAAGGRCRPLLRPWRSRAGLSAHHPGRGPRCWFWLALLDPQQPGMLVADTCEAAPGLTKDDPPGPLAYGQPRPDRGHCDPNAPGYGC